MHLLTIPPRAEAVAHLHEAHETAIYVISGGAAMWYGDDLSEHMIVSAGDLLYIPAGVPHLPYNPSDSEPAVAVIARTDPNEQESVVLRPDLTPPPDEGKASVWPTSISKSQFTHGAPHAILVKRTRSDLHNANIYTVDPALPTAQAVAIRKHRIYAVGNDAEICALAGPATRMIDAQGRLVLPGLCDAHIHFFDWSLGLATVRLADTMSKAEMLTRIAERAAVTAPGEWIVGRGWNESRWGETAFPDGGRFGSRNRPGSPGHLLAQRHAWCGGQHGGAPASPASMHRHAIRPAA